MTVIACHSAPRRRADNSVDIRPVDKMSVLDEHQLLAPFVHAYFHYARLVEFPVDNASSKDPSRSTIRLPVTIQWSLRDTCKRLLGDILAR